MKARLAKLGIAETDPNRLTPEQIEAFVRLDIDASSVTWKRVTDTNDRFLRGITLARGPDEVHKKTGQRFERESGFAITVAFEIMAVLALATDLHDLRTRLGRMIACFSSRAHRSPPTILASPAPSPSFSWMRSCLRRCRRSRAPLRWCTAARLPTSRTATRAWSRTSWRSNSWARTATCSRGRLRL